MFVNNILYLGLVVYVFYLPFFVILLFVSIKRNPGYSLVTEWTSNLGKTTYKGNFIFNASVVVLGILSLFFVRSLSLLLPDHIFSHLGTVSLYLVSISTILIGFLPADKKPDTHMTFSSIMFSAIASFSLFLIYPILNSSVLPNALAIINLFILLFSLLMIYSVPKLEKLLGTIPDRLVGLKKKNVPFVARAVCVWEWMAFFLTNVWSFMIALSVLSSLSG